MEISIVNRNKMGERLQKKSKYKPLLEAIKKLTTGDNALKVSFEDKRELNSMRNIVYSYNRETGGNIKSSKHHKKNIVYFYKPKEG